MNHDPILLALLVVQPPQDQFCARAIWYVPGKPSPFEITITNANGNALETTLVAWGYLDCITEKIKWRIPDSKIHVSDYTQMFSDTFHFKVHTDVMQFEKYLRDHFDYE